jgi:hypothetical protein
MGIYTRTLGTAPNRVFVIEWRAGMIANDVQLNFEALLYEGQPKFELVYGPTRGGGFSATIGVQKDTGSRFTQHACDTQNSVPPGRKLIFSQCAAPSKR